MTSRFDGKVAVVTGAGTGIGRAVALLLAEEGASVVVNDLGCEGDGGGPSHESADRVVDEIRAIGGKAVPSYGDVAVMAAGENLVKTAVNTYGRLDVLVNSTAILSDFTIREMTALEFDRVLRNNLKGAFVPSKYAAIEFRRQRSGRIVNMTSDAGLGAAGRSNYAASSEAIIGLTRTVARDLGKYGVTCNAISALARTRLLAEAPDEMDEKGWEGPGGPDDPENVAPLVVLLCTDAVPNANGHVFGVHGGNVYVYTNPLIERSVHKWGAFTMDELDELVPKTIGASL